MNNPFLDNHEIEQSSNIAKELEHHSSGENPPISPQKIPEQALSKTITQTNSVQKISKPEIRSSLRALTAESVLATVFYSTIGGALLSNFLLDLGANAVEIGMLASIPQIANLLQPFGAYLADRTTSRYWYSLYIFGASRLMWLILVPAILLVSSSALAAHQLVQFTLAIIWVTNIMEALGRASFFSWIAALVPQRLRGRYFGFRNSAVSLVNLLAVPLLGLVVSKWPSGRLQGYCVILGLGIVLGLSSLVFQSKMTDVNPKLVHDSHPAAQPHWDAVLSFLKNGNFLRFLFYSALWSFAVNISAPFFNLYLLDNLAIDISVVTIYNSLGAGANLLMLMVWGKLADRVGNRPIMVIVGVLVALTPLLWLESGTGSIFLWLWFPLLFVLGGGTWAAIDLCSGNLLMSVTPLRNQSIYFAIAAAVPGVTGAMGITTGSFLATATDVGGLPGLFALSAVLRLVALMPLVLVHEQRSVSLGKFWLLLLPAWWRKVPTEPGEITIQPLVQNPEQSSEVDLP